MSKKRIVIVVDNPLRDLPACSLLALELSQEYDVYLTPVAQAPYEIFRLGADLVLLNYIRISNQPLLEKLIASNIPYSVLDTEGGVFLKIGSGTETSYTKTILKDERLRNNVQQYFVWGKTLYSQLLEGKVYPEKSLLCLGTPRTDFYHPRFQPYFSTAIRDPKPMVLVNTSFPSNNPKFSTRQAEANMLIEKFNYSAEFISELFSQLDLVMQDYVDLVKYLAPLFPQVQFVVRPHPFENLEFYQRQLSTYPNVDVNCVDAVAKWIWESKVLVHYECSTALEAGFAGRPSISLAQHRNVRPIESVALITEYAKDFEEVRKQIASVLNGTHQIPTNVQTHLHQIENDIYFKVDGHSYLRIADAIRQWFKAPRGGRHFVMTQIYKTFFFFRSIAKFATKKYLVPPEKRFSTDKTQEITDRLSQVIEKKADIRRPFLSSSLWIQYRK